MLLRARRSHRGAAPICEGAEPVDATPTLHALGLEIRDEKHSVVMS